MRILTTLAISALLAMPVYAQRGSRGSQQPAAEPPEDGIPVTDPLVLAKCGGCHTKDEKGNLSRISWERSTPEGWEEAIKRMVRLNGAQLTPVEARSILKYLSTYHGLAPEEAKPAMYYAEHRVQDETVPNESVRSACTTCHILGRAMSWRRTKEDWRLLTNMHVALYSQAEAWFRRPAAMNGEGGAAGGRGGRGGVATGTAGSAPAGPPVQPVDEAIDVLSRAYPLHTPEWASWRSRMRTPKLAGRWLVSATIAGHGKYFGEMVVEPGAAEDEFTTRVKLQSARDGSVITRSGQGLVYAGYSWRGRSKPADPPAAVRVLAADDFAHDLREVLWFSPDQSQAEGRWFWGEYQEFGFDVKLRRASSEPSLTGVDVYSLKTGETAQRVRLIGDSFPADAAATDLDFGAGIKIRRLVSHTGSELVAEVDVAADAVPGQRDIAFRRSVLENALAVYDKIDYIKVIPEASLARLGSETHPKGYQQFDAVAYHRGADGKPHTADDVDLGPVKVTWSVEEFYAVYGDDDKDFVGKLDAATGLFTPASDGPNPLRKFSRNNYGDVWVVATSASEKDAEGKPLVGRSYLVVTVPTYIRWDQAEVGQ